MHACLPSWMHGTRSHMLLYHPSSDHFRLLSWRLTRNFVSPLTRCGLHNPFCSSWTNGRLIFHRYNTVLGVGCSSLVSNSLCRPLNSRVTNMHPTFCAQPWIRTSSVNSKFWDCGLRILPRTTIHHTVSFHPEHPSSYWLSMTSEET